VLQISRHGPVHVILLVEVVGFKTVVDYIIKLDLTLELEAETIYKIGRVSMKLKV